MDKNTGTSGKRARKPSHVSAIASKPPCSSITLPKRGYSVLSLAICPVTSTGFYTPA
jgi:hypothetical protein